MHKRRATVLKKYVRMHVPYKLQSLVYRSFKEWWCQLSAPLRAQATAEMRANRLPLAVGMSVPTPGAPPPKRKRVRA